MEKILNEKNFLKLFEKLNPEQKKAVETLEGSVLVKAGPGTGKTQILALRILNILYKTDTEPENILALTFTNAGVSAMKKRLSEIVGPEIAFKVNIFTFHSFAENLIKEFSDFFPDFLNKKNANEIEKIEIVEDILKSENLKYLKSFADDFFATKIILNAINELKSSAISPEKFEESFLNIEKRMMENAGEDAYYKRVGKGFEKGDVKKDLTEKIEKEKKKQKELLIIYEKYQKILNEKNLYDFSDTILSVVEKAREDKNFLTYLQEKYFYILVDEHQDTNDAQNEMAHLIGNSSVSENNPNIFSVGDEKQAINRFQGASLENFLSYSKKYPKTKVINLNKNYRSSEEILNALDEVLKNDEKLSAENPAFKNIKKSIEIKEFNSYEEEILGILEEIKLEIKKGKKAEDFAVFYRENKNLDFIKKICQKKEIPFTIFSRENILENIEIKYFLQFLKAIFNPFSDKNLSEVLFTCPQNFSSYDVLKILEKLSYRKGEEMKNKNIIKIISNKKVLENIGVSEVEKFLEFSQFLEKQKKLSLEIEFSSFLEKFLRESGFYEKIMSDKNNFSSFSGIKKLFDEVLKNDIKSLEEFCRYLEILEKYEIKIESENNFENKGVRLMTVHGSKGLEFKKVYLTNFIDSKWKGRKRGGLNFSLPVKKNVGDLEDEKRLFYVALSRAQENFFISYAKKNSVGKEVLPSRFLEKIEKISVKKEIGALDEKILFKQLYEKENENEKSIFNEKYIKELFKKNTISFTAFSNYKKSPILYFFRNLIRLPSVQTRPLIFGNIIHKTLEIFFEECKKSKKILDEKFLLDCFEKSILFFKIPEKDFENIEKRGFEILKKYYQKYKDEFSFDVFTEEKIYSEIISRSGEKYTLYGIVDKMEILENDFLRVVDYKTGKSFSEKKTAQEKDLLKKQLVFYKLLLDKKFGKERVSEGILDFVEENKKGIFEKHIEKISKKDVDELEAELLDFIEDVETGKFLKEKYKKDKTNEEYWDLWEVLKGK